MKYPEKGVGGPESGSLPGFPCSPTSYMAAMSNKLHQHVSLLFSPGWNTLHQCALDVKGTHAVWTGTGEPFPGW